MCSDGKELQQEPQAITLLYRGNNYSYTQAIKRLASGIVAGDIFFKVSRSERYLLYLIYFIQPVVQSFASPGKGELHYMYLSIGVYR